MRAAAPVHLNLRRSWLGAAFVLLVHGASAALATLLPLPRSTQLVLAILIFASAAWQLRAQLWPRVLSLVLFPDHRLHLALRGGAALEAEVLAASVVLPWLVIVRHRAARSRWSRSTLVLPDMCSAEEQRRFRIALRWRRPVSEPGSR